MVRTKADSSSAATRKVVAARAPRKVLGSSSSAGCSSTGESPSGKGKYAGGNPVCPRPTPDWQKGIGMFLANKSAGKTNSSTEKENSDPTEIEESATGSGSSAGPSSSRVESDDDTE